MPDNNLYMSELYFSTNSEVDIKGISNCLKEFINNEKIVIVCIGTDLAIGDSLGPITGSLLSTLNNVIVYGNLDYPITAKETETIAKNIKQLHPESKILVIDAAVGNKEDIGMLKVANKGIKPGLGVNKNLSAIGDYSIIGIVSEKNMAFENIISNTRLNMVIKMSTAIRNAVKDFLL